MRFQRKTWVIIALAAPSVCASLIVKQVWFPGRAFDRTAWDDESQVQHGVRLGMADRLLARGKLMGNTRDEIVNLLGEPPATKYAEGWDVVYWLGPERGFLSLDSEWLVLKPDGNGRVADAGIHRD